jgi:hypothetical protein
MSKIDRVALKKSIWGSLSRVIGIGLSAGAGSMIHRMVGNSLEGWSVATVMAVASFVFMAVAEYERERG